MLQACWKTTKLDGTAARQRARGRAYLMELKDENLLLPYYLEAGIGRMTYVPAELHGGWDSPLSQIRGTVLGHWLSAAAQTAAETGDGVLRARTEHIVAEIARCEKENGGGWCFPIPEKYLHWLKNGKRTWAPQYVCHKVMMGLLDAYRFLGNRQALDLVEKAADWFDRFTVDISPEHMAKMMWEETGGMMELFADLYAVTGKQTHLELMRRYERRDLLDALARGEDPLTNRHANATVPEILGVARAYEVTGEERYRAAALAYWDWAVTRRGAFATGSQTSGEIWTPPGQQSARLAKTNQEHCFVYHMMCLAGYLFRWTGESVYADYWERNFYNGLLAQGFWQEDGHEQYGVDTLHPKKGYVAYHLPLHAGARKVWGSATGDFWCCHCTLMQANARYPQSIYFQEDGAVTAAQYLDSSVTLVLDGNKVEIRQTRQEDTSDVIGIELQYDAVQSRPGYWKQRFTISSAAPAQFTLKLRRPWWLSAQAELTVNGQPYPAQADENGFYCIERTWSEDTVDIKLPKTITTWALPDREETAAFLDGPVVLAGLCAEETALYYEDAPEELLIPYDERVWNHWQGGWQTRGQARNIRFVPLHDVGYEPYTVYFPMRKIARGREE